VSNRSATDARETERLLADARRKGDLDDVAEALMLHANALVNAGQIAQARQELDEAAEIHRQRGRTYDEARCTHLAATLCRLEGHPTEARVRAERAAQLVEPGTPIAVSAATELGEIALLEGKTAEAADAYTRALASGEVAGMVDAARATLLRKRAIALTASGRHRDAAKDLAMAQGLLLRAGDTTGAIRALIEEAAALQQGGFTADADRVKVEARRMAEAAQDHVAQADLDLLDSTQAVTRRDVAAAMAAARSARQHALEGVAPILYVSASLAIAQLAEATGDRLGAYEALAVGWVTLGDLLGREVAMASFEPKLFELRERWGVDAFAEVKAAYEARRRAERGA
jgi:tetratricopeptide (TPR) repeat protein